MLPKDEMPLIIKIIIELMLIVGIAGIVLSVIGIIKKNNFFDFNLIDLCLCFLAIIAFYLLRLAREHIKKESACY